MFVVEQLFLTAAPTEIHQRSLDLHDQKLMKVQKS